MHVSTLLGLGLLVLGSALFSAPASAWYGCPTGYNLEVRSNGNSARCLRPEVNQLERINKRCPQVSTPLGPVGAGFKRDYLPNGGDACVTQTPGGVAQSAVPHDFCPGSTRTLVRLRGRDDRCRNRRPADEKPVVRNVR